MADPEHLEILKQGVEVWNEWRRVNPEIKPDLKETDLALLELCGINISRANLIDVNLHAADLPRADLRNADLSGADLSGARLENADLSGACLENADFSNTDLRGASFKGADFIFAQLNCASLNGANLTGVRLTGVFLVGADLSGAHLDAAYLDDADLRDTDLRGAHISNADLSGADLSGARLENADLSGADLNGAKFSGANLGGADFTDVKLGGCLFVRNDLSQVKGLETTKHSAPSSIGIDTIYESRGKIPQVFLRGCGVPENFITYMRSLTGYALEFYKCFISFTEADDAFSERLYNDLQANGVRCWRWKEDAKWGKTLMRSIDEAVRLYDKLIIICSEQSLNSPAVIREIERALQKEDDLARQGKDAEVLFPIRLDDYIFMGWHHHRKADVTAKNVGDFRQWKSHDDYQKAFDRLLRDLKTGEQER